MAGTKPAMTTERIRRRIEKGLCSAYATYGGRVMARTDIEHQAMTNKTAPFNTAEYLDSPQAVADYLSEAFETGDDDFIAQAIGTVARAQGMSGVAPDAGVSRENLYRALGANGRPEFATVMKVLDALGVQLVAKPKAA
jgi:probable addiction module antidote protein